MRILIQLLRGVLALVIGAALLASAWLALGAGHGGLAAARAGRRQQKLYHVILL